MFGKFGQVARFEFVSTMSRPSVLMVMFGLPFLLVGFMALINRLAAPQAGGLLNETTVGQASSLLNEFVLGEDVAVTIPAGLVDETGHITQVPPGSLFVLLPGRDAAQQAYAHGEVSSYYVIPAGYLDGDQVEHYAASPSYPRRSAEASILYRYLVGSFISNPRIVDWVIDPAEFEFVNLAAGEGLAGSSDGSALFSQQFLVGIGVAMLFFAVTMGSAGYLLQTLGKEKQNRVMEILLSSVPARSMLFGKIMGLGAVGLVQLVVWSSVSLLVLGPDASLFANLPLPQLSPARWLIVALFFIAGYFVYASLFAGLGAMAPNPKEGSQYTFFITLPVFLPLWFNNLFWTEPDGPAALALSLFPLTAPLAMPMRLVATDVPAGQWLSGLLITTAFGVGVTLLVARIFRGQNLLSGQSLSLGHIWRTLRGR